MSDPPPNSPSLLALLYASDEDHQVLLHRLGLLPSSVQDTGTEQHTIENTPYQTPPAYYAGVQYEAQSPMGLFPAEHMLPPQPLPFSQPAPFMGAGGVLAGGHPEPGLVQDNISAPKTFASSTGVAKSYRVPNAASRKQRSSISKSMAASSSLAANIGTARPTRAQLACDPCRAGKWKCEYDQHDAPENGVGVGADVKCRHCTKQGHDCTYSGPRMPKGRPRKLGPRVVYQLVYEVVPVAPRRSVGMWFYKAL